MIKTISFLVLTLLTLPLFAEAPKTIATGLSRSSKGVYRVKYGSQAKYPNGLSWQTPFPTIEYALEAIGDVPEINLLIDAK